LKSNEAIQPRACPGGQEQSKDTRLTLALLEKSRARTTATYLQVGS